MFEKLELMLKKFEELTEQIADPEVIADQSRWQKLVKEHSQMSGTIELYKKYLALEDSVKECKEIIDEGVDEEMCALAKEELAQANKDIEQTVKDLKVSMLPVDPNDDNNVIVEVRAGAGGEEGGLFGAELVRMYMRYAERMRWKIKEIDMNYTELGGAKEVTFMISGTGAYAKLKYESGVHRVQRVPETESQGRVHTSTATVAILPEAPDIQIEILEKDLKIDTYRSSGAGGQHVNKTSSAVRLIHKPTGVVVSSQQERSQVQNRENCMKMLRSKLMEMKAQQHAEKISDIKGVQMKIEWGSQIRSYVFMPYTLAKDTRTGYENGNINSVMDGDLDGFINAYLTASATGELKNGKQ